MFSSKISRFLVRNRRLVRNVSLASTVLVGQQSYYSSVCDATGPSHLARRVPLIDTVNIEIKASYGKRIRESLQWLKEKIDTIVALISRALYLILAFSPATLSSPLLLSNNAEFKKWWWSVLRDCVRKGGPCATKFAQWISTRPDLFPLSLCKNLEDLQSKVVKHCWQDTESAMILAFGDDWRKTIRFDGEGEGAVSTGSSFSPVVLGSGCVAQVLLGTIDDRKVAVKIIHPGKSIRNILCCAVVLSPLW